MLNHGPAAKLALLLAIASSAACSGSRWNDSIGPARKHSDSSREETLEGREESARTGHHLLKSFGLDAEPRLLERAWKIRAPGLIADLSVSERGDLVVASTIFDSERPSSDDNGKNFVAWGGAGELRWSVSLASQTRVQDVSPEGTLAWVASYDGDFQAWDLRKGRRAWALSRSCRPVGLADSLVLCVRDDEARPPETLFEAIDGGGAIFFVQPRGEAGEVLSVKRSADGRFFALLLSGGEVQIYKAGTFQQKGSRVPFVRRLGVFKAAGEPLDLEFGMPVETREENSFLFSVLSIGSDSRPRVEVADSSGRRVGVAILDRPALQVGCTKGCRQLLLYGNGLAGQWLGSVSLGAMGSPQASPKPVKWAWLRSLPRAAEYSSRLLVAPAREVGASEGGEDALVGFEWTDGRERRSFLVGFDVADGSPRWLVPIDSGEGAYLYAFGTFEGGGPKSARLVIATDDGWLRGYRPL